MREMEGSQKYVTLAFDRQIHSIQRHGGISRYFRDLESGINQHDSIRVVPSDEARLVHASFYLGRPHRLRHQRLISSLYDMTPELYPELFPLGRLRSRLRIGAHANKKSWLKKSDAVISISDTSTNDFREVWPDIRTPTHTIHLGTNIQAIHPQAVPTLMGRRFWLIVGKRIGYKNGAMLLEAMRCVSDCSDAPLLVAAGGGSWNHEEKRLIEQYQLDRLVRQFQVTDYELSWLYRHCEAVLIPSRAEGFSLPLIESLCCNAACIASDIPVHAEVGGPFAHFLPSTSESHWMDMLATINQHPLPTPKELLGDDQWAHFVDRYSLDRMVSKHVDVYCSLNS